jgi:hypothetical protein
LNYTDTKNEIISTLELVSGIGKVYPSMQQAVDLKTLEDKFVTNGKFNVAFVSRLSAFEDDESGVGSRDETDTAIVKQVTETWNITLFYAFKDSISSPSEFAFQALVDAIREKFRWLNDLNANAYKSYSVNFITTNVFEEVNKTVTCHRGDGKLVVKYRLLGADNEDTGGVIAPKVLLFRRGTNAVQSTGTIIEFTSVDTADYDIFIKSCVNGVGESVGFEILSQEDGSFSISAMERATVKWVIMSLTDYSGIQDIILKRGTNAVTPSGTTISFQDIGTDDYDVLIQSCKSSDDVNVAVDITGETSNSFVATSTENATLKWILLKI